MKNLMRLRWLMGVLLFLTALQTASAFYDPAPQRWINRDPIIEQGWNLRSSASGGKTGRNLFTFVGNNSLSAVDPFGLKLWMCTRLILGGIATHAYIWDDRDIDDYTSPNDPTRSCGQGSSSGSGTWGTYSKQDKGPPHDFVGGQWKDGKVTCKPIENSDGKEDAVRKCCTDPKKINDGPWFPFFRDCHNQAVDCLTEGGIDPNDIPSHPRLPRYPLKTPAGRHGETR